MIDVEVREMRSEPILLLETELARYIQMFVIREYLITGGMVVESRLERHEKGKKVEQ